MGRLESGSQLRVWCAIKSEQDCVYTRQDRWRWRDHTSRRSRADTCGGLTLGVDFLKIMRPLWARECTKGGNEGGGYMTGL